MHTASQALIETIGQVLDSVDVGVCVFDANDCVMYWNCAFLRIFPEHVGHIHMGEKYRVNLRRFYQLRLKGDELAQIDHYIDAGVARHREQTQSYEFEHLGQKIEVASLPLEGIGRIRVWHAQPLQTVAPVGEPEGRLPGVWLDGVPDGLMVCASNGLIQWVNESFVQMYGLPDRSSALSLSFETVFQSAWSIHSERVEPQFQASLRTLRDHLRFKGAPFELALPGNRFCRVIARPSEDGALFVAHVDITQLKRQQQQLALAERAARDSEAQLLRKSALLEAALESLDHGVAMVNPQGVVEVFNQRTTELLGIPRDLLDRHPFLEEVVRYQHEAGPLRNISRQLQDSDDAFTLALPLGNTEQICSDGRTMAIGSYPVRGGGTLHTFTDITERKRYEQRIEYLAHHDGLTGLLNRGVFQECLAAEVATIQRHQGAGCAVFFIDLDGFKPINDQYGHAVGDKALQWVAAQLRAVVREGDFTARLGGDEFAVLQRQVTQPHEALRLAERLQLAMAQPLQLEGHTIHIGASVGMALCPEHGHDAHALLRHADRAMYTMKAAQRDRNFNMN